MLDLRILLMSLTILLFAVGNIYGHMNTDSKDGYTLSEIVITSDKLQEYIKNHPQDVSVIQRKEILERSLTTVEDVLKTMPGVEVIPSRGIGSRISIRGSGKSGGLLLLLDGRPLSTNQFGNFEIDTIPIDMVESVMVFKPPIPVWLGPGGSEGAINIVTRSLPAQKEDREKYPTTIKASGGSYGLVDGSISQSLTIADGGSLISASARRRDGKRENSDRKDYSLAANWNRETQGGAKYEISARYYDAEYGMPGPLDNLTPDARQQYRKGSLEGRYSGIIGEGKGTYTLSAYGDMSNLRDKSQTGFIATLNDNKLGLKLDTAMTHEKGLWDIRLGGMLELNDYEHTLSGSHHRIRNSLSGQYDRRFGDVTGTLGLRADYTNDFHFNPGFTGGLGWGVTEKILIKAKAGYTVNVPTFEQLYQTTHGSIDQTRGNPNLKKEKIWSYDLGIEYKLDKDKTLQFTLFRADTTDLISYKRGDDKIYRPINIPSSHRQGVELTAKYNWGKGLITEINAVVQDSRNSVTGKELSYTPKVKLKGSVRYTISDYKTRIDGTVRYEGKRFNQIENLPTQQLEAYTTVDAKVTQPFKIKGTAVEWYLKVDNLFNASYQFHYGYPDDGRKITSGIQMRF